MTLKGPKQNFFLLKLRKLEVNLERKYSQTNSITNKFGQFQAIHYN
jgi:hypothetical protein